jgi:hypothetical protein
VSLLPIVLCWPDIPQTGSGPALVTFWTNPRRCSLPRKRVEVCEYFNGLRFGHGQMISWTWTDLSFRLTVIRMRIPNRRSDAPCRRSETRAVRLCRLVIRRVGTSSVVHARENRSLSFSLALSLSRSRSCRLYGHGSDGRASVRALEML